eukprot:symbB.v1.2.000356.t1/scaffold10.1/size534768/9
MHIYLQNDHPVDAVNMAKEVVSTWHKAGDVQSEARSLLSLAELLLTFDTRHARKVLRVAREMLQELHMAELKDCEALEARCNQADSVAEVERALHRNRDFIHVPRMAIVDPGGRQRLQDDFEAFAKAV